jgi:preprotein translocase subunit SecB
MNNSTFNFLGYKIVRSLIEKNNNNSSIKLSLNFSPKGEISEMENKFNLFLRVDIEDENKSFKIEVDAIANFGFESTDDIKNLDNFFFINAPAILFPYIRAYISTLTNLSGFPTITLPTLNMTSLGDDLKKNTIKLS